MYDLNIKKEKRKAFQRLLKKYVPISFLLFIAFSFNIWRIIEFLNYGNPFPTIKDPTYALLIYPPIVGYLLYYLSKDYLDFVCLYKDKYKIVEDCVAYAMGVGLDSAKTTPNYKFKRKKITFENTYLTFYDAEFSEFRSGDKVYLWISTEGYDRILHITKKE